MGLPITHSSENPTNSETSEDNHSGSTFTSTADNTNTSTSGSNDPTGGAKMSADEAADKLYEERIEEEYAKREGGA